MPGETPTLLSEALPRLVDAYGRSGVLCALLDDLTEEEAEAMIEAYRLRRVANVDPMAVARAWLDQQPVRGSSTSILSGLFDHLATAGWTLERREAAAPDEGTVILFQCPGIGQDLHLAKEVAPRRLPNGALICSPCAAAYEEHPDRRNFPDLLEAP